VRDEVLLSSSSPKARNGHSAVLHRDVYWLGRQWAVTGYGVQTVSKSYAMRFDVEAARIWEDGLEDRLTPEPWFDADDFRQALAVARKRSQESPKTFLTPLSDER
jgi:hypothetical protein